MKNTFETVRRNANMQLAEVIKYNKKVRTAYFHEKDGEVHFVYKYKNTYFKYFVIKVTAESEDEKYRSILQEFLLFVLSGAHLKMMKDPIEHLRNGMTVGVPDGIMC